MLGNRGSETTIRMDASQVIVPGFRSEPVPKSRTINCHNRSPKKPPFVVEVGCYNFCAAFPVEFDYFITSDTRLSPTPGAVFIKRS